MSPLVVVTCFGLVAVAELPDKTMIATLVMGSRGRPVPVWLGASAAFLLHVVVAVAAGHLLTLLPHRVLEGIITAVFLLAALYLLLVPERSEIRRGDDEARRTGPATAGRVALTAFTVILVGEIGDLTQLLTVNLAARYHQPFAVAVGAWLGLVAIAALGAFSGRALLRVLPVDVIRRIGGVVLLGLAAYTLYGLATS